MEKFSRIRICVLLEFSKTFFSCRLNNLSVRYRENLELVLKDLTINIQPGEKVEKYFSSQLN